MAQYLDREGLKAVLQETRKKIDEKAVQAVNITYAELKELRDGGKLTPGRYYRITDYECTTTQEGTKSAGHPYDIIMKADSASALNEEGSAALHESDTYFAKAHLEAWKVWYALDNDQTRFGWADTENGKGVVYRLIDNWGNDCSYDFKNILFTLAEKTYSENSTNKEPVVRPAFTDVYTFNVDMGGTNADSSVCEQLYNGLVTQKNVVGMYYDMDSMQRIIPKNVFCVYVSDAQSSDIGVLSLMTMINDLGNEADDNVFCHGAIANIASMAFTSNYFAQISIMNTFSGNVYRNTFSGYVWYNTFSGDVENNTFSGNVYENTFSGNVYNNTFSGDVWNNTFSGYVWNNTFSGTLSYSQLEGQCQYCLFPKGDVQYIRQCGETIGESDSNRAAVEVTAGMKYEQVVTADKDGNIVVKTPWI